MSQVLVQLIQTACKNDKLPRALKLTCMLHHTPSFDMAMRVTAFYCLIGLQEKVQARQPPRLSTPKLLKRRQIYANRKYDRTRAWDPLEHLMLHAQVHPLRDRVQRGRARCLTERLFRTGTALGPCELFELRRMCI